MGRYAHSTLVSKSNTLLLFSASSKFISEGSAKVEGPPGIIDIITHVVVLALSHVALHFATRFPAEGLYGVALSDMQRGG